MGGDPVVGDPGGNLDAKAGERTDRDHEHVGLGTDRGDPGRAISGLAGRAKLVALSGIEALGATKDHIRSPAFEFFDQVRKRAPKDELADGDLAELVKCAAVVQCYGD